MGKTARPKIVFARAKGWRSHKFGFVWVYWLNAKWVVGRWLSCEVIAQCTVHNAQCTMHNAQCNTIEIEARTFVYSGALPATRASHLSVLISVVI